MFFDILSGFCSIWFGGSSGDRVTASLCWGPGLASCGADIPECTTLRDVWRSTQFPQEFSFVH